MRKSIIVFLILLSGCHRGDEHNTNSWHSDLILSFNERYGSVGIYGPVKMVDFEFIPTVNVHLPVSNAQKVDFVFLSSADPSIGNDYILYGYFDISKLNYGLTFLIRTK